MDRTTLVFTHRLVVHARGTGMVWLEVPLWELKFFFLSLRHIVLCLVRPGDKSCCVTCVGGGFEPLRNYSWESWKFREFR